MYISNLNAIDIFIIIDNDTDSKKLIFKLKNNGMKIKRNRIYRWKKDFEYDNFGILPVITYVNKNLREKGLNEISIEEIKSELSTTNKVLMNLMKDTYNRKIRKSSEIKFDDIISKKRMGRTLIQKRLTEITSEQKNKTIEYKPKLPIEKIIFKMIFSITRTLDY